MESSKVVKKNIIVTVLLSVAILLFVVAGWFFVQFVENRFDRVVSVKEQIATYQTYKTSFEKEVGALETLKERLDRVEKNIITKDTIPALLSQLESTANAQGLSFQITSVETPIEDGIARLDIECTADGTFATLERFFDTLLHQGYAATFTRIEFIENISQATNDTAPKSSRTKVVEKKEQTYRAFVTIRIMSF